MSQPRSGYLRRSAPPEMRNLRRTGRVSLPLRLAAVLLLSLGLTGCFGLVRSVEEGIESATQEVIGDRIVPSGAIPTVGSAEWNEFMVRRAEFLFGRTYAVGGYWPVEDAYEPGEWTRFRYEQAEQDAPPLEIQRTFVRETDEGLEWWRVEGHQEDMSWAYEGLLDPEREQILRLRARDPNGDVREIPVTEEQSFYPRQQTLTEESLAGATTGEETLETPAGTFTADRVEYEQIGGGEAVWWLTEAVPSRIAQYRLAGPADSWTSTLVDYGTLSEPELELETDAEG